MERSAITKAESQKKRVNLVLFMAKTSFSILISFPLEAILR